MHPIQHIIVATDFGEAAARASELAVTIARKFDAKLTLVHAYSLPIITYATELSWPMDDFRQAAEKTLEDAAAKLRVRYPRSEHVLGEPRLNHRPRVDSGLLADDSTALLRAFFGERRG